MKNHVNLLPWRCRRTQIIRLRFRQWLWPCGITAAAIAIFFVVQLSRCLAARQRLDQVEREYFPLESLTEEIAASRGRLDERSREVEIVRRMENPRPPLTLLGLVSQTARDCQGQLHVESLSLQAAREQPKTTAGEPAKTAAGERTKATAKEAAETNGDSTVVAIKGIALDNLAVARFVAALRQTKAFRRVELKSTKEQPLGACRICSWLIECGY
jgi:hypothetical protein